MAIKQKEVMEKKNYNLFPHQVRFLSCITKGENAEFRHESDVIRTALRMYMQTKRAENCDC